MFIALFQSYGIAIGLESMHGSFGAAVIHPGWFFRFSCVVTLVGGTMFLMWVGEQITARGVGNGTSLIIMAGIVANLPGALASLLELGPHRRAVGVLHPGASSCSRSRWSPSSCSWSGRSGASPVQYPKRQVGNRMFGGDSTHMPLKLNTSGVIPPIFASSILLIPATIAGFSQGQGPGWLQWIATAAGARPAAVPGAVCGDDHLLLVSSTPPWCSTREETADNLKKYGGFIPGIRPGSATADYFDHVLTRLTTVGGLYLVAVCLLPEILISDYGLPFYFGGTSILIVVSVTMDTVTQIQSHLLAHQYEGLIRKARVKGRR